MIKESESGSGQVIIEFACALPLLLIFVLGILEFGILFYNKAMVTNASREGARAGIAFRPGADGNYSPVTEAEIQTVIDNYLQTRLITFGGTPTAEIDPNPRHGNSPHDGGSGYVDVVVKYKHTFLTFPKFVGLNDTVTMAARTRMRLE
jgi:hypothetical protein